MSVAPDSNILFMPYFFLPQYCPPFVQKEAEPALPLGGGTLAKVENVFAWIVFDQQEERVVSSELRRNYGGKAFFWPPL